MLHWRVESTDYSSYVVVNHLGLVWPIGCWRSAVDTFTYHVGVFFPLFKLVPPDGILCGVVSLCLWRGTFPCLYQVLASHVESQDAHKPLAAELIISNPSWPWLELHTNSIFVRIICKWQCKYWASQNYIVWYQYSSIFLFLKCMTLDLPIWFPLYIYIFKSHTRHWWYEFLY